MSEFKNLNALADQLYRDGMEKAQKESDRMLSEARNKADERLAIAVKEADEIISKAKKDAEKHRNAVQSEILQKAKQAKQDLKIGIEKLINVQILSNPLKEVLSDQDFVKKLIISSMETWKDGKDVELSIPESLKDMESDLRAKVHKYLPDLIVSTNAHLKSGFQIENKEKGYILSFTESDFQALFEPYLTDSVRDIVFNQGE
ncbi:MAG: hypothetical protein RIA69_09435 [Cyclobacteriaceae bacterium]